MHEMIRAPGREYRSWVVDSRRWQQYKPRSDDIVIATYPKCGTTWTQQIVSLLIFQSPEPVPVMKISPWIDRRFGPSVETVLAEIEAQEHRRFLKSHLPFDGLPFYDDVKYIHVGRDGRDACMSYHNHVTGLTPATLELFDKIGVQDEKIGRPYPRPPADPAEYFHRWVADENVPVPPFFHFEESWWNVYESPNVLFVHYNDLKADLSGEMRRIAEFLEISVRPDIWPLLVAAAGFEAMREAGDVLMSHVAGIFQGGSQRFFHRGTNARWHGIFREADLALYDLKLRTNLPAACARWVTHGRLAQGGEARTGRVSSAGKK
ncbi:MAG TPA: sulfotransferase domain-containing protein [Aestuariivirgaceae bacterium]|jgi:aryl sulfotransferase